MIRKLATILLFSLLAVLWITNYAGGTSVMVDDGPASNPTKEKRMSGLTFRMSEGEALAEPRVSAPKASVRKLTEAEAQRILDRMPPLEKDKADEKDLVLPPGPVPPPKTGKTVDQPFPPEENAGGPGQASQGPLTVLRYAPEGDVPLAPHLSLTFSQPMVALSSQDEMAQNVPVRLTPQVPGSWRWLGTKTLMFQPQGRFPMATAFQVEAPAGTKSVAGGTLAAPVSWKFQTPPVTVESMHPQGGPHPRNPLLFLSFNQKIDSAALLKSVRVTAGGGPFQIRLADQNEIDQDPTVARLVQQAQPGRFLVFRTTEPLPYDADVKVVVESGAPSAEGPLKSTGAQPFSFETYGRLEVVEKGCRYHKKCPPLAPWYIRFSNPIDEEAFDLSQVVTEPAVEGLRPEFNHDTLYLKGLTRGRTEYKVTFKAGLKDVFDQTLEKDTTVTFKVDSADPMLSAPAGNWVVLDPSGKNAYSVYSMNFADLRIRLLAVGPDDYRQYLDYLNEWDPKKDTPPGRLLSDQTIRVKSEPDVLTETAIDLTPALKEGRGQVLVVVEPGSGLTELFSRRNRPRIKAWVQATRIGLDAFADPRNLVVRATSLVDGSPLAGVQVQGWPVSPSVITGPDGLARLPLSSYDEAAMKLVVGALGPDRAVLRQTAYSYGSGGFQAQPVKDTLRWYVVDDRQMYRPGEEVRIKGWIRREGGGPDGDLGLFDRSQKRIHYDVLGPQGNEITKGQVEVGPYGGFDLKIDLPKNMNLGTAQLRLSAPGGQGDPLGWNHQHEFQVQEFRRPEFEVTAQAEAGPFVLGGSANVEVKAAYYAGGGLPNAEVTWEVRSRSASYSPPGWSAFIFGRWLPWWLDRDESGEGGLDSYQGVTDPGGTHRLKLDFLAMAEPFPQSLDAEATVMDVNRQAWTASRLLLVHPSEYYVGLKPDRTFVQAGEPFHLDVVVSDLDGKAVPGQLVNLKAVRLGWVYKNGRYLEEEAEVATGTVTSAAKPVPFDFRLAKGGTYQVTAEVADGKKRLNRTQMTAWVAGGDRPLARNVEQESAMLIPDKEEYQAGETAEILVQTPFWPAEGLVSWRRSGILKTETIRLTGPSYTLKVPIEEAFVPNLNVDVDLVGAAPRVNAQGVQDASLPKRPAFAKGRVDLKVPPRKRTLTLDVAPQDKDLEPGGQTVVNVKLTDSSGKPVAGGEVAVAVVDEAVLALTGHRWPDPIRLLYPDRSPLVEEVHTRSDIILAKPEAIEPEEPDSGNKSARMTGAEPEAMYDMAMAPPMPSAMAAPGGGVAGPPAPAIRVRIDFNALAVFSPTVPTDGSGRAQIKVKLPDSLTRYRIMAVAAAGDNRFGLGEAGLRARLPLMVRPSAPRFLNFGDQFELPVTLQNQTGKPMRVGVALRATHLELTDGNGREVEVPADNRVEVRFPARTLGAGTGRFQVAAASGGSADGAQGEIPVLTPATTEAAATYGEIDDGVMVQPVAFPQNVFTGFGGLDITTSSTALGALTDAFLYLVAYPFDCSEQVASRVLSVAALRDVLTAFKAEGLPPKAELDQAMARDIERLAGLQNSDGGFPIWRRGEESWPYHSIHGAHALARAKAKGYAVPQPVLDRSLQYLRNIENNIPRDYGESSRRTLIAYALYVRTHLKDPDRAGARKLIDKAGLEKLHPEAIGWLLYVLAGDKGSEKTLETIHRHLQNRVTETAGAAQFTTGYDDGGHVLLHSDRRTDGIVLEALIQDQPKNDLIPKLVHGLMAHRKKGRWLNTQENVFILLALDRYFAVYEAAEPDFVARVWLGDQFAGQSTFKGRSPDQARVRVPMARLAEVKKAPVLIQKDGPGRLYYRLGLNYAPQNLWLAAADYGFAVEREYEAVDDPKDVTRTKDGYQVKAGARVRVKLTMVAPARRYHVALIDPLPAGFEALNPALAVTGTQPVGEAAEMRTRYWWWGPWYEHQNLRDSRAEAFTTYLWDGVYTYTYIARATTPGAFVVPPAKAEEMYAPETFGRSASDRVTVVD